MPADRITLAVITGAQGVRGEVRLKLFVDDPAALERHRAFEAAGRILTLARLRAQPNGVIASFRELTDRTAAESLRGVALSVPRETLEPPADPDEYYQADLIGLAVRTPGGAEIGRLVAVENYGAGDLLEIERADGNRFMLPFRAAIVPVVDVAGGYLIVDPDALTEI